LGARRGMRLSQRWPALAVSRTRSSPAPQAPPPFLPHPHRAGGGRFCQAEAATVWHPPGGQERRAVGPASLTARRWRSGSGSPPAWRGDHPRIGRVTYARAYAGAPAGHAVADRFHLMQNLATSAYSGAQNAWRGARRHRQRPRGSSCPCSAPMGEPVPVLRLPHPRLSRPPAQPSRCRPPQALYAAV